MINAFDHGCIQQLHSMAAESPHPSYLLVDGVFIPSILSLVEAWPVPVTNQHALFDDRAAGNATTLAASPWLLPYPGNQLAVQPLLRACDGLPSLSLIRSSTDLPSLLARLKRWTVVNCDNACFNFRYPDTRRLPGIHRVMTDEQRLSLFGTDDWSFIGRDGRWQHIPPISALDVRHTSMVEPLGDPELSDAQFAALLHDSEPDEQLAAVWQDLPEDAPVRAALASQKHRWTASALAQADRLQLDHIPDRTLLCAWVLSSDPEVRLQTLTQQDHLPANVDLDDLLRQWS